MILNTKLYVKCLHIIPISSIEATVSTANLLVLSLNLCWNDEYTRSITKAISDYTLSLIYGL